METKMSESHFDQMTYLMGFIFLLVLVIIGTIAFSIIQKRKLKKETSALKEKAPDEARLDHLKSEIEKGLPYQNIKVIDVPVAAPAIEKEISIAEDLVNTEASDCGPQTVEKLLDVVKSELSSKELGDISSVKQALQREMTEILEPIQAGFEGHIKLQQQIHQAATGPTVLMIVGVNGAGKTTSIGKITSQLAQDGQKVLVAAGDTFRAAAGNQLKMWTDRAQATAESGKGEVEIFWPTNTTDPSAVAFDAVQKAKAQNFDYVILDTAGRLHTQVNLMDELKKVKRVMAKVIAEAPHETWIVLDANSGQNALMQAKEFHQALTLSGVVLTKMDGTAKGGVALGLVDQLQIHIKLIGIGEKITDLRLFKHTEYVNS